MPQWDNIIDTKYYGFLTKLSSQKFHMEISPIIYIILSCLVTRRYLTYNTYTKIHFITI